MMIAQTRSIPADVTKAKQPIVQASLDFWRDSHSNENIHIGDLSKGEIPVQLLQDLRIIDPKLNFSKDFHKSVTEVLDKFVPPAEFNYQENKPRYLMSDSDIPFALSVNGASPPIIVISRGMFSEVDIPVQCREKEFGLTGVEIPVNNRERIIASELDLATVVIREIARNDGKGLFDIERKPAIKDCFVYLPVVDFLTRSNHNPYNALYTSIKYEEAVGRYRSADAIAEQGYYYIYNPTQALVEPFIREFIGGFSSTRGGINKNSDPKKFAENHPILKAVDSEIVYESEFSQLLKNENYSSRDSLDAKLSKITIAIACLENISNTTARDIEDTLKPLAGKIAQKKAEALIETFLGKVENTTTQNALIIYQAITSSIKDVRKNSLLGRLKKLETAAKPLFYPVKSLKKDAEKFVAAVENEPLSGTVRGQAFLRKLSWSFDVGFTLPREITDFRTVRVPWQHLREAAKEGSAACLKAAFFVGLGQDPYFHSLLAKDPELTLDVYQRVSIDRFGTGRALNFPSIIPSPKPGNGDERLLAYLPDSDTVTLAKSYDEIVQASTVLIKVVRDHLVNPELPDELRGTMVKLFRRLDPACITADSNPIVLNEDTDPKYLHLVRLVDGSSGIWSGEKSRLKEHQDLYNLCVRSISAEHLVKGDKRTERDDRAFIKQAIVGIINKGGKPQYLKNNFNISVELGAINPERNSTYKLVIDNPANFLTPQERLAFLDGIYVDKSSSDRKLVIQQTPALTKLAEDLNIDYLGEIRSAKACIEACKSFANNPSAVYGNILRQNIAQGKFNHTEQSVLALIEFHAAAKKVESVRPNTSFEKFLPETFRGIKFSPKINLEKIFDKLNLTDSVTNFTMVCSTGLMKQEIIDNLGSKIAAKLLVEQDPNILWQNTVKFLAFYAGVQPEERKELISKCAESRLLVHGVDDHSPEYQRRILADFNVDFKKLPINVKVSFADEIAVKIKAQFVLADKLKDQCFETVGASDFPETLSFLFEEHTFLSLPYDYQKRKSLIDFLRFPYSEERGKVMMKSLFEIEEREVSVRTILQSEEVTDERLKRMYEAVADVREMAPTELIMVAGELKIDRRKVLEAFEKGDKVDDASLNLVREMHSFSERFYNEFHALGIEKKAMICRRLLYPALRARQEVTVEGLKYLTSQIISPKSPEFDEFNRSLSAYLNSIIPDQRGLVCTALLLSSKGLDPAVDQIEVGEAIGRFVGLLGPIERRLAQFGANIDTVPAYIRVPFQRIKSDADKPYPWEHQRWVEQVKPDLTEKLKVHFADPNLEVVHSDPVMGSASMGVANRISLSNGQSIVLYLLRPFTVQSADQGIANMKATLPELQNEAMRTVLGEVLTGLDNCMPLETNLNISKLQFDIEHKLCENKYAIVDGHRVNFFTADVLASGHIKGTDGIEYRYYAMTEVPGEHLDTFHELNPEIGNKVLIAHTVFEMIKMLNGVGDLDRQEKNSKAKGDANTTNLGHFDLKATRLNKASDEGIRQLADIFICGLQDIMKSEKELPVIFMEQQEKLREKYGGKIDEYIPDVHRRLLANLGCLKRLENKERLRVIASAVTAASPVFKQAVLDSNDSSMAMGIMKSLVETGNHPMLTIALGKDWLVEIKSDE